MTGTIVWSGGQSVTGFADTPLISGGVVSRTLIVERQELEAPAASLTVRVPCGTPRSNGPDGDRMRRSELPSGSKEPLLTSSAVTKALQAGPAGRVTS